MLLDYVSNERRPEEGVRVAGLLDIVQLAKLLGNKIDRSAVKSMREAAQADPLGAYNDSRTFIDPIGRLMADTGPTFAGRPLREYKSIDSLRDRGQELRDYLSDTEMGAALAPHLSNIKVGRVDAGNFDGGYIAPRADEPGVLVINRNVDKARVPELFEHEMQHVYQGLLDMPRGTNLDEMSDDMMSYLIETGRVRPAQSARIDRAAGFQGVPRATARYASTIGEAEARAAQVRQAAVSSGYRYTDLGKPRVDEYQWTPLGYEVGAKDFFALPQDAADGFQQWWQRKWR